MDRDHRTMVAGRSSHSASSATRGRGALSERSAAQDVEGPPAHVTDEPDDSGAISASSPSAPRKQQSASERLREKKLREDTMALVCDPRLVQCRRCGARIKLSLKSAYDPCHWQKHRMRCLKKSDEDVRKFKLASGGGDEKDSGYSQPSKKAKSTRETKAAPRTDISYLSIPPVCEARQPSVTSACSARSWSFDCNTNLQRGQERYWDDQCLDSEPWGRITFQESRVRFTATP